MNIWEFLKPDKKKIIVAIATSLIFFNTLQVLHYLPCITGKTHCMFVWSSLVPLYFVLLEVYFILWGVLFYPFACSLVALYDARKDLRTMHNKIAVILGLILFNPLVVVLWISSIALAIWRIWD